MAIDLKKLDLEFYVETIGLIGDDEDGRVLLAEADAYGIERSQLAVTGEASTAYTDAYSSRATGRRTHLYHQGTGALLTPDHFDFTRANGRILHLGLPGIHRVMDAPWNGDANGWVTVLRKAQAAGLTTNMELASVAPEKLAGIVRPCLPYLDMLIVNDTEIGAIAGTTTTSEGTADVKQLRRSGEGGDGARQYAACRSAFPLRRRRIRAQWLFSDQAIGARARRRGGRRERRRRRLLRRCNIWASRELVARCRDYSGLCGSRGVLAGHGHVRCGRAGEAVYAPR